MSSSPDLSRRARLALAASLVVTAWSLPRLSGVQRLAGGTAVSLAAGACALVALPLARLPLGFSSGPARSRRLVPDVASGFALGAACAAALIWDGNDARLAQLWRDDRAAAVALLAGVAAWGAAIAATRQRALWRWYAAAAVAALLPEALLFAVLRGFVAGGRYAPSGSRSAAALYHGLHNAPLKALGGAPIATGRAGLAAGLALGCTAALAIALGWLVWQRGGREASRLS